MILAWKGTDRDRNLLTAYHPGKGVGEGAPADRVENRTRRIKALRAVSAFLAVLLNLASVVVLRRNNYDSLWAGLGWAASLALLAAAFAGDRRRRERRKEALGAGAEEPTAWRLTPAAEMVVVLAIFALALGLRLYRLGDWTGGMHGDEGEVGMDALRILRGQPAPPFQTGWFGQPNFYYWGIAIGMKLFGTGLAGLRMFSALAGALIILPFYPLARQLFGVRTAILAALFLAISDVAIHFSRQEFSNITTPLFLVTGFFLFFRGLRNRRPVLFVLAGYAHEACLYFYLGGRLTPIVAAAFIGYLLILAPVAALLPLFRRLRAGDPQPSRMDALRTAIRREVLTARPYVLCVLLYAVASLAFAAPWIAYYRDHRQMLNARVSEKLVFNSPALMAEAYSASHDPLYLGLQAPNLRDIVPLPIAFAPTRWSVVIARDGFWPQVFWGQLKRTLSILTYSSDASGVYTFTQEPAAKPIEAVLIVLGIGWALWRWRDTGMALLSLWFWLTILVGGVMTIDAPYMARLVGIIPVLALFVALVLDKLAAELVRVFRAARSPRGARLAQTASIVALLSLVGYLTWQNTADYFGRYLGRRPFGETVGQASFVRDLNAAAGKEHRPPPQYYDLGAHAIYWGHAVNRFLNRGASGQDVANASEALPILDNDDRDAVFMVWDLQQQYLPLFRAFYPGAKEGRFVYGPPGHESPLFTYYRVDRDQIDARRALQARYVPARGAAVERREGSLGLASPAPAGLVYPVRARWQGSLVVPGFGRYRLRLESSGPASLFLDNEPVLASRGKTPRDRDVVLARGVHAVSLDATLAGSDATVRAQWSVGDSPPGPIARRFLWSGPGGSLLGEVRPLPDGTRGSVPSLCGADASVVTQRRLDGFLGFRDAPAALQSQRPLAACWSGDLRISRPGEYQFDVSSNGGSRIFVDGKPVVDNRHGDGLPKEGTGRIALTPGTHRLEVAYSWARENGILEVSWTPPGGERVLVGGEDLVAKGGLWRPGQVAEPAGLSSQLIQEMFVPAQAPTVSDTRGCALDAGGDLYVADTQRARVAVWDGGGTLLRSWGTKGRGPGKFINVEDVSIGPDGLVSVLDSGLARVQVFARDGHFVRAIENVGCSPAGITVAADGSIYIASTCESVIRRYAPSGKPIAEYRGGSDPATRLEQPVDVVAGPGGLLYVADLRDRVVKLDPSSDAIVKSWPVRVGRTMGGANLALGGRFLYLTDPDLSLLYSIDTESGRIETLPAGSGTSPAIVARQAGIGPCTAAHGAFARFPLCLGELLARCRDRKDSGSPR